MAIRTAGARDSYGEINLTPLIDVMLVLLVIFIITIPIQTHAIKMDNPTGGPSSPRFEVIDLGIDFDGTLLWNQVPVDRKTLQQYISREARKAPQPEVHISVDRSSKYQVVAQTLADLQQRGLKKVGFVHNDLL